MNANDLKRFKDWFYEYIRQFYGQDEYINANLELKREHTKYVVDEAGYISRGIGLDDNEVLIAETTALMHDVGRFEQFYKYRTYSDRKSVSHSDLGFEIIQAEGVLDGLDPVEKEMILSAVKYHGIKDVPDGLDERTLLHSKIVRDADKLDIYRVLQEKYTDYIRDPENYNLELELPDEPWYSDSIIDSIMNCQQVHYSEMHTLNDMKLLILAMVFDVNFEPTLTKIRDKKYVQAFVDMLPKDETIEKAQQVLLGYIDKRLG